MMFFGGWAPGILMLLGGLFRVAILVGLVLLVYGVVRHWGEGSAAPPTGGVDPLGLASARYARGEITRDEFLQIQQDLQAARAGERR